MSEKKISLLKRKLRRLTVAADRVETHRELAEYLYEVGEHADALDHLKEALSYCNGQLQVAHLQRLIGEIYIDMNQPEFAEPYFRKYLENAQTDNAELQKAHLTLGRHLYIQGIEVKHLWAEGSHAMLVEGRVHLQQALQLDAKLKAEGRRDLSMLCRVQLNLGLVVEELDGARDAATHLKEARKIASEHQLREEEFRCLSITANLFRRHGGIPMATGIMQGAALAAAKAAGTETECQHALDYTEHLIADQKLEEAEKFLAQSIKIKSAPVAMKEQIKSKYKDVQRALRLRRRLSQSCFNDPRERFLQAVKLAKFYCSVESCQGQAISLLNEESSLNEGHISNQEDISKFHKILGLSYQINGQYRDAIVNYEKAATLRKRSSTLRGIALCKLMLGQPYSEIMSVLEEAGKMELDMVGRRSLGTLNQMMYTRKSFGIDASEICEERKNLCLSNVQDISTSSDSDASDTDCLKITVFTESSLPVDCIELLLDRGANPCLQNTSGHTPLQVLTKIRLDSSKSGASNDEISRCKQIEKRMLDMIHTSIPDYSVCEDNNGGRQVPASRRNNGGIVRGLSQRTDSCKKLKSDGENKSVAAKKGIKRQLKSTKEAKRKEGAFVSEAEYAKEFMVPDNEVEFVESSTSACCDSSPLSSPECSKKRHTISLSNGSMQERQTGLANDVKHLSEEKPVGLLVPSEQIRGTKSVESGRIRIIAHVDCSPQAKLLVPFALTGSILELKREIENRIRRKLSHLDAWVRTELYDMSECLLDEVDILCDVIPSKDIGREEWLIKVRLVNSK